MTPPGLHSDRCVFGYGSLVALERLAHFLGRPTLRPDEVTYASLVGYVRRWNVAMDNSETIPGYKVYLDDEGARPDVFVTFLNVARRAGVAVNGVVVRVSATEFERIRRRERSYRLTDVSADLDLTTDEPVYAGLGRPEAVARFERGSRRGRAVVVCSYVDEVEGAFRSLGPAPYAAYRASTEPIDPPCRRLYRVALSG